VVSAHLLRSWSAIGVLKHLLQKIYNLVGPNVVARLTDRVLDSVVLPSGVHLLLQWRHSTDQPVGSHADSDQAEFFQLADSAGQGGHNGHLGLYRFFNPCHVIFRKAADDRGKTELVVLAVKPLLVPALEGRFQGEIKEITMQAGQDVVAADNLALSCARLVFQEKVMLEE
jgi:hypothetical protein